MAGSSLDLTFSKNLVWNKIKYYLIPVEVVVFLYIFTSYFHSQIYQQYFYQIYARQTLNLSSNFSRCLNQTDIVDMSDNATFSLIQQNTNHLNLISSVTSQVPAVFVLIILGGLADKFGRKIIMFVIFIGLLIQSINGVVVVYYQLNMYMFLIGSAAGGITGGFGASLIAGYSYVADITPRRFLTIRIGTVQLAIFAAAAAGAASSNSWLNSNGCDFHPPMWLMIVTSVVSILYVMILPESLTEERKKELAMKPKRGLQAWITAVKIYFWPPFLGLSKYWRVIVATLAMGLVVLNEIGNGQVTTYFFENKPLEWSLELISMYTMTTSIVHCIALVIVLPILVLIGVPDVLISLIGVLITCGAVISLGFVQRSWPVWLIFLIGAVQSFSALITPSIRSMMSKLVEPDDQGALFSFLFTVEMSSGVGASVIYMNLYQSTGMLGGKKVSQSLIFWVMAGIWGAVIPLLLLLLIYLFVTWLRRPPNIYDDEKKPLLAPRKNAIQ